MSGTSILLIGPGSNIDGGRVGGITIPFEEFSVWCKEKAFSQDVKLQIFPLSGKNKILLFFSYFRAVLALLSPKGRQVVSLHVTWQALIFFSPWIVISKHLFSKKITIRKFAGNFDEYFDDANFFIRFIVNLGLRHIDIAYFETQYLLDWALRHNYSAAWWPNSRHIPSHNQQLQITGFNDNKIKCAYIGQVSEVKGVAKLIKLAIANPDRIIINLYGVLVDKSILGAIEQIGIRNIEYRGTLSREGVFSELINSDVLLVPTEWTSEGYPGVIVEAACVGIPTISSKMRGPLELIEMLGYGWSIDYDEPAQFSDAIDKLSTFYMTDAPSKLSINAQKFSSDIVFESKFKEMIALIC